MQKLMKLVLIATLPLIMVACGSSAKDEKGQLGDKKAQLEKLKGEQKKINDQIAKLEEDIAKLDPSSAAGKSKLVAIRSINNDTFLHFIELQGKIDAKNVAYVAPRGQGGQIRSIYVKQGDRVRKGQLILKLDDAIARQSVVTAQQQVGGVEAQLAQAKSIYERQQNLWKQNIGTEVQVLNAKTNVETLQSQLNAARANVKLMQEQVALSNVYASISGTIDQLNVKVGEFFSPQSAAMPTSGITIVNTGNLKVLVQVPENYMGKVKEGVNMKVTLPELNRTINSKVMVAGQLIDPITRSFYVEGNLPSDKAFRPNQIANVRIQDYSAPDAITIPVNTLQNDLTGKYVLVAVIENGKLVARKKKVTVGQLYNDELEVTSGLQKGDQLIVEGFQGLYDGQTIITNTNS